MMGPPTFSAPRNLPRTPVAAGVSASGPPPNRNLGLGYGPLNFGASPTIRDFAKAAVSTAVAVGELIAIYELTRLGAKIITDPDNSGRAILDFGGRVAGYFTRIPGVSMVAHQVTSDQTYIGRKVVPTIENYGIEVYYHFADFFHGDALQRDAGTLIYGGAFLINAYGQYNLKVAGPPQFPKWKPGN
jgi:hypothetical protein